MSTTSKILQYAANGHPVLKDDFELMQDGGHIKGYKVEDSKIIRVLHGFDAWIDNDSHIIQRIVWQTYGRSWV